MKKEQEAPIEEVEDLKCLEDDKKEIAAFLKDWPKTAFYTKDLADLFEMSIFRAKAALKSLQEEHKVTTVGVTFDGTVKWTSLEWR